MLFIEQLTHVYPNGTRALESVSLDVPRGMFGLLGPNGAGKSTLMRCVASLQIPTSGRIRFDGINVIADPTALRRTLGYLPQDFGVYPRVSAGGCAGPGSTRQSPAPAEGPAPRRWRRCCGR